MRKQLKNLENNQRLNNMLYMKRIASLMIDLRRYVHFINENSKKITR
mgnify:CR=1 FL=1